MCAGPCCDGMCVCAGHCCGCMCVMDSAVTVYVLVPAVTVFRIIYAGLGCAGAAGMGAAATHLLCR